MTYGTRLRKYREKKRFSQKEVAEHLGISQTTYCNWENDTASYQVKYLPLLAQLFGVNVLELIFKSHNEKASNCNSQDDEHVISGSTVADNSQVYTNLLKSKEDVIQLLRDENNRLKALTETRK